jgi:hypothetical protein
MNSLNIADAIAAQFAAITVSGQGLAICTARLPNQVSVGPALLVYPPTGELEAQTTTRRNDLYTFPVRILLDPTDYPTRTAALYGWYDAIHDLLYQNMDIGLGSYVSFAEPVAVRIELDGEEYAGSKYDVVELMVEVRVNEHISGAAV